MNRKVLGIVVPAVLVAGMIGAVPASAVTVGSQAIGKLDAAMSTLHVLVMGDSYSAGNGAGDYYGARGCWRSHRDYAQLFAAAISAAPYHQPAVVTNVACSGAVTMDFFHSKDHRPPEIDAVNRQDNLIFVTIGGNDVYFPDIVQYCLVAKFRDGYHCDKNLSRAERMIADGTVTARIVGVLRAIRARANPDARIVLLGYPYLEGDLSYVLRSGSGKNAPLIKVGKRLHALGTEGDQIDSSVVAQLDRQYPDQFIFVSVHKLFDGPPYHGLYAKKNNPDRWMIQPFVDAGLAETSIWYHPNPTGWMQESKLLLRDAAVPKEVPPLIVTTTLPDSTVGEPYSAQLTTADHRAGDWAISGGSLPKGLRLRGYTISGTAAGVGEASFDLKFTDREGQVAHATATLRVLAKPVPPVWGQPAQLRGTGHDDLTGVSCVSATDCVAVDASGYALTYTSAGWSAPQDIDDPTRLNAVSCASATFCDAVDAAGDVLNYEGTSWAKPQNIDATGSLISISCASASFCAAADPNGYVYTFDGTGWSGPTQVVPQGEYLNAISCPTASFCVAVGSAENAQNNGQIGQAVTYSGATWTAPATIDSNTGMSSVSCVSATFCMAVDDFTGAVSYNGTTWSGPVTINSLVSSAALAPVACASADLCVEGDYGGDAFTYNGSYWSNPVWAEDTIEAASCTRGGYCVVVDRGGNVVTYAGGQFSRPITIDGSIAAANAVSCASSSHCAVSTSSAGGGTGFATLRDATWLTDQTGVYETPAHTVSCPSATFCAAATVGTFYGFGGYPMTAYDSQWSRPEAVYGSQFGGGAGQVSCVKSGFCVGVGDIGPIEYTGAWARISAAFPGKNLQPYAVSCASAAFCLGVSANVAGVFNGTAWSAAGILGPKVYIGYVACPAVEYCIAVGQSAAFRYVNGNWSPDGTIDSSGNYLTGLSCAAVNFCIAVDNTGNAIFFNGQAWRQPEAIDSGTYLTGVSCPTVRYCMAVDQTGRFITGTS